MSRFKNEITHLQAHIKTLRLGAGALVIVALVMGGGWWSAPRDLTIHVPPDLRSGSTRKWWDMVDFARPPSSSPQLASPSSARRRTISRRTGSLKA